MNLYNQSIAAILGELEKYSSVKTEYDAGRTWPDAGTHELVLLRDAAFELGGSGKKSVNCTCVTSTPGIVPENEVVVIGPDLNRIHGDSTFARIALLEIEDPGESEEAYDAIKKLEYVRYNVFPKGYMSRTSSESNREEVRVSKEAVRRGINFAEVGNSYIKKYLEMPGVKHVRIIFAVNCPGIDTLIAEAKKVSDITSTLTHIFDGLPLTNCAECQLKPVCDSVEGLREMHMKQKQRDRKFLQ